MTNTVIIAETELSATLRTSPWPLAIALIAACFTFQGCARLWGSKAAEIQKLAPILELSTGSTAAEIGAGSGAVAVAAAQMVGPNGHVYATEIDPQSLAQIRSAATSAGLTNLSAVESTATDTRLPEGCCDAIYMIGVYHHFTDPIALDASIFRAMRPGGRLVIVDFRPSFLLKPWTPKGIPANRSGHGIPPSILEAELTHAGFRVSRVIDPWGSSWFLSNYCVVFTKPVSAR